MLLYNSHHGLNSVMRWFDNSDILKHNLLMLNYYGIIGPSMIHRHQVELLPLGILVGEWLNSLHPCEKFRTPVPNKLICKISRFPRRPTVNHLEQGRIIVSMLEDWEPANAPQLCESKTAKFFPTIESVYLESRNKRIKDIGKAL